MKLSQLALITLVASTLSFSAFAEDKAAPATPAAPTTTEAAPTTEKAAKSEKVAANKMPVKQAREACLKDNPELKGKELSKCIREKRNAK